MGGTILIFVCNMIYDRSISKLMVVDWYLVKATSFTPFNHLSIKMELTNAY